MIEPVDYARPSTPAAGANGTFLTAPIARTLRPRLLASAERMTLGPDRPTAARFAVRVGIVIAVTYAIATFSLLVLGVRMNHVWLPAAAFSAVLCVMVVGSEVAGRRRAMRASDWLTWDFATGDVAIPAAAATVPKAAVARVELLEDVASDRLEGEIRLVVQGPDAAGLERVGVVRTDAAVVQPIAPALAAALSVPLYEYAMRGPGRAIVHRTLVGGAREKLTMRSRESV